MEADDLSEFEPEWVDPVSTTYRGWTVYEMPPNGQGIAALQMLNIMEQFPMGSGDTTARSPCTSKSKPRSWHMQICGNTWAIHAQRTFLRETSFPKNSPPTGQS